MTLYACRSSEFKIHISHQWPQIKLCTSNKKHLTFKKQPEFLISEHFKISVQERHTQVFARQR